jgi:hypothetical protein
MAQSTESGRGSSRSSSTGPRTRIASGAEPRLLASSVLAKLPRTISHDGCAAGPTQREWSMQQARENGARPGMGTAAAVLFTAALCQPNLGHAGPHGGGGGFHGGEFHGSGFKGFHESGFYGGGWHGGFAGLPHGFGGHSCHRFDGWRNGRDGWWRVPGWDGLPIHIRSGVTTLTTATRTTASFTPPGIGYYCSDPAGYHPYVTQCSADWQPVPAS